jgi:integrase
MPDDVDLFCRQHGYAGTTRRNYVGAFKHMINFYTGKKRVKILRDEKLPTIWPAETVSRIFQVAEMRYPKAVPALALLFFCGLRPHEVFRATWDQHIDLEAAAVKISPEISKVRTSRHVDIPPNALKWLAAYREKSGLVCGGFFQFRRLRELVMKAAGLKSWPVDVARHTYATAHYTVHGSADRTMQQLGHFGSSATFVRHYKSLMTTSAAKKFFEISPRADAKIIKIGAAS